MAFAINTNIMSLVAQQNLNSSKSSLNQAIERLSSGKKINSAADDAAGQAISNRMTAQINGLNQASSNANDGISLAQTAEGALDQINDNLQRIRTLSVQAANGTNSTTDLQSIQDEIDERMAEIDRVSTQTDFNGVKVLSSGQSLDIQVGANDGQTITIDLQKISTDTLSLDDYTVVGYQGTPSAVSSGDSVDGIDIVSSVASTATDEITASAITIEDTNGSTFSGSLVTDDNGNYFVSHSGSYYAVTNIMSEEASSAGSAATLTVTVDGDNEMEALTDNPLNTLDQALAQVGDLRSNLGAMENRFDSAINNIETSATNLSSARSRIVDADYAQEVSEMSKAQILQQAGTAVLAQANQTNAGVLSLLR